MEAGSIIFAVLKTLGIIVVSVMLAVFVIIALAVFLLRKRLFSMIGLLRKRKNIFSIFLLPVLEFAWNAWSEGLPSKAATYRYRPKSALMTKAERSCFDALVLAMGGDYHVLPRVALEEILDWGENENLAFARKHLYGRCVDFLLADQEFVPKLAVFYDEPTKIEEEPGTKELETEALLRSSGFPFLHVDERDLVSPEKLRERLLSAMR